MQRQRHVTHLDIPAFPAAVEQAKHPAYRNRPVIVSSASSTRSVVLAASPEARREGVFKGMLLKQALKQATGAIVVEPNPELYHRATQYILQRLERFSPYVEPVRYGQIAVDLTGTTRLFGRIKDTAYNIYKDLQSSCGLAPSIGIAVNKLVSGIAARYIQSYAELFDVLPGSESQFLEPLDVKYLPGIGGAK
ncbi:MAG: DNA polymerase IV, partial [Candidatus Marinimicrobia bacterium]|nr:DNA polymerase IV [Candidatus Neomarinimicrobiota bacterium]